MNRSSEKVSKYATKYPSAGAWCDSIRVPSFGRVEIINGRHTAEMQTGRYCIGRRVGRSSGVAA